MKDRMHLDCVFSILGDNVCLMMEEMMGADSPTKRLVDEWSRDEATGGYNITRQNVEFSEFMEGEGYKIVAIKAEHQLVSKAAHRQFVLPHKCSLRRSFLSMGRALKKMRAYWCLLVQGDYDPASTYARVLSFLCACCILPESAAVY